MASRTTSIQGAGLVAFNLRQMSGVKLEAATKAALANMGKSALEAVRANVTRRDHTLDQLAAQDHPYARRHGTIRVHPSEPHVIHTRSGRLAAALHGGTKRASGGAGAGGRWVYRIDFSKSPPRYLKHVIVGTKVMLGRDVLGATVYTPQMRMIMFRAAVTTMGRELRTQAGLRFPSGGF